MMRNSGLMSGMQKTTSMGKANSTRGFAKSFKRVKLGSMKPRSTSGQPNGVRAGVKPAAQ